jgi:hypothetical protein
MGWTFLYIILFVVPQIVHMHDFSEPSAAASLNCPGEKTEILTQANIHKGTFSKPAKKIISFLQLTSYEGLWSQFPRKFSKTERKIFKIFILRLHPEICKSINGGEPVSCFLYTANVPWFSHIPWRAWAAKIVFWSFKRNFYKKI